MGSGRTVEYVNVHKLGGENTEKRIDPLKKKKKKKKKTNSIQPRLKQELGRGWGGRRRKMGRKSSELGWGRTGSGHGRYY